MKVELSAAELSMIIDRWVFNSSWGYIWDKQDAELMHKLENYRSQAQALEEKESVTKEEA